MSDAVEVGLVEDDPRRTDRTTDPIAQLLRAPFIGAGGLIVVTVIAGLAARVHRRMV